MGRRGSHTVLTGFEVFNFTDGTVHNDDGSPLIDDLFYYSKYHDVWTVHADADAHYNSTGWHEGRDPDAFFSTAVYLSANPDVKAAGVNPLTHFDAIGWKEGRMPVDHLRSGAVSRRQSGCESRRRGSAAALPRHRRSGGPPALRTGRTDRRQRLRLRLLSQPQSGRGGVRRRSVPALPDRRLDEGRNPNALFDTSGYLATYTDVHTNPLDHYNTFGWHEGRDPSVGFDTTSYLAAYPDVNAAHVNPLNHFLHFGIHEGRSPFADGVWG